MTRQELVERMAQGYMNGASISVYSEDGIKGALQAALDAIEAGEVVEIRDIGPHQSQPELVIRAKKEFRKEKA